MGLFDFIRGQFIEVIEWLDDRGIIAYRFPVYDHAIKMGAKLIVRESQAAIFVHEGHLTDVFGPGTYELSTHNMPVLTALNAWKHGFKSPFKSDVYFVNRTNFTNMKWGTTNPVIMRDAEFGIVRARGFGNYAFKVGDPALFLKELLGTKEEFTTDSITGHLKSVIVSGLSDLLGEAKIPVIDLASSYDELGQQAASKLQPIFAAIGLSLSSLTIENISLPDEVEKMIDRRSSMNIAGNLDSYMKFQTAEAIREAANNPNGGAAGAGAGLGAGMAMGQMMGQMINNQQSAVPQQPAAAASPQAANASQGQPGSAQGTVFCTECGTKLSATAKFCSSCGSKL